VTEDDAIDRAARILRAGGLVAFPTETVYGLGADATQGQAVARIYAVKGRPSFNPLIVHVADRSWLDDIAVPPSTVDVLTRRFWPGPLTLVVPRKASSSIAELATAGLDTVAVRAPAHDMAQALLKAAQRPLAAPSANPSGLLSPTRAEHVIAALGDKIDMVLDGGPCRVGLESTVLDVTGTTPVILRPGAITAEDIGAVLGTDVAISTGDPNAPSAPGQLASHYAPRLPLRMNAARADAGEALLGFGRAPADTALNLSPRGDLLEAAANLFTMLRALDDPARFRAIAVMPIPDTGIGIAINDRLRRAAAPRP
jgi:L-threonylcarbamoyladenylate synthase